jgi:hypothetical protein
MDLNRKSSSTIFNVHFLIQQTSTLPPSPHLEETHRPLNTLLQTTISILKLILPLPLLQFPYGDMLMAFHLEKRWKKLFGSALYRLKTLHSTKIKFSQMTSNDIEKFKQEVSFDFDIGNLYIHKMHLYRRDLHNIHNKYHFSSSSSLHI